MEHVQATQSTPKFFLWYIESIKRISQVAYLMVLKNLDYFSIPLLLKTFFQPWKRDILSTQGLSLNQKFQIWTFNLMSRIIGAIIRFFTIIIGLILTLVLMIFGLLAVIAWILMPIIILYFFVYGFYLISKG